MLNHEIPQLERKKKKKLQKANTRYISKEGCSNYIPGYSFSQLILKKTK